MSDQPDYAPAIGVPKGPDAVGLYDPRDEHDACGVGFIVDIKGRRSHEVVRKGLEILINLLHRGACGCEANTGDGAGILIQTPDKFVRKITAAMGVTLPPAGQYGTGLVFLPRLAVEREQAKALIERIAIEEGQQVLAWRMVPTADAGIGESALATKPVIEQIFIGSSDGGHHHGGPDGVRAAHGGPAENGPAQNSSLASRVTPLERKLYVIRKRVEHEADGLGMTERHAFYFPSLSSQTMIYKGMLIADQIESTFPDLRDPDVESALALVHQRFSTNTFPSWPLAHPYRYIAHNGEINTLRGNINWMRAREGLLKSAVLGDDLKKILPIIREGGSDTATFDNVLEFLVMTGRSLPHAILMMIPEPWSRHVSMRPELKAFY
jgi:glutamate synthase domain-containing protein 1